jgi:hypothetical protein
MFLFRFPPSGMTGERGNKPLVVPKCFCSGPITSLLIIDFGPALSGLTIGLAAPNWLSHGKNKEPVDNGRLLPFALTSTIFPSFEKSTFFAANPSILVV